MAVTKEQVAELYVAFFDRAPDSAGLDYWVASGLPIEDISASFFDQDETKTAYPDTMTNAEFVDTIYVNMFNHNADPDGLTYWTNELESDSITRANMILAIANGALGTDQTILDNKTEVGLYFADAGLDDTDDATTVMDDIDETAASVSLAKQEVDTLAPSEGIGKTYVLTTGVDTVTGTTADDTIKALVDGTAGTTTYTTDDIINGGAGDDSIAFTFTSTFAVADPIAVLSSVENVKITAAAAATLDAAKWSGVESYNFDTMAGIATSITKIRDKFDTVTLNAATNATAVATLQTIDDLVLAGTADTVNVVLEKSSAIASLDIKNNSAASAVIESYAIESKDNSANAGLNLLDTAFTSVTITGNKSMELKTTNNDTKIATVDASALNGGLTYAITNTAAETVKGGTGGDIIDGGAGNDTIMGGAGDDTIDTATVADGGNDTIDGGAGKDTITTGTGINSIKGGEGDDTITTGTGTNSISGGAGQDTITLNAAGEDTISFLYDTGITTATADIVKNFQTGTDKLSFGMDKAGTLANFASVSDLGLAATATVEEFVSKVNEAQITGLTYLYDTVTNMLAIDSTGNGEADMAIDMDETTTATTLTYEDIIA